MEGQMHLSGQLSDWSIHDLLQIMQVTKKTGSLDLEGEKRGRVHFRDGQVVAAELSGTKGVYRGVDRGGLADILYVLSTMTTGTFSVGPADGPDGAGWSVETVLADVEALRSLEGEIVDAGLFEAPMVRLSADINSELTISPEDWPMMMALVPPFAFSDLESKMGRGGAVRVLHTLHSLGVVETVNTPEQESDPDWLDRVAEEVAPATAQPTWFEESAGSNEAEPEDAEEPEEVPPTQPAPKVARGVAAPASTTLVDGVYDEIRRLRSKAADER